MEQFYFHENCKVCGRPMIVSLELLNAAIRCGHCGAICDAPRLDQPKWHPQRRTTPGVAAGTSNRPEQVGRVAALLRTIAPPRPCDTPLMR
ncbi:hypothetical protein Mal33_40370 [Rosistilla oblonga]|uniref:Uncharacterized protein n=2 Tax=Rosistilla oblonga TaxID=2527990 RepID=A0A518IY61_9BACT|nr:hypothetical protein Mal33_40370 [Rosistilla oblonga]